ncbi:virulence-associated protein E [Algoriphagus ratkowskyi]|uniref:Virulence protein E n=1 Tax=Algoriphagus ratkowskyi TaxID=57028 RepID=A0A2W7RCZ6_9BACT|nr:VapE domain-containing protein [Algoriphagus ratkowskyi]PZX56996.1 virulence-associated protein E [Algoriphagus ratkowskyi]TXD79902.1 virulence protein E [Algoriphagus ratkowskyi]
MKNRNPFKRLDDDSNSPMVKMIRYLISKYDFINNVVVYEVFASEKEKNNYLRVNPHTLLIEAKSAGHNTSLADINSFLSSDFIPKVNPLEIYFEHHKKLWSADEHGDYIERFANYIEVLDQARFQVQFKKWLVRCVACSLDDQYFNKQALILVQDKQNSGKSTLTRFLTPPDLSEYQTENISIDKDSLIALCQNFLIIQDELSTLNKQEINAQKSLMSRSYIKVRHPYDRKPTMEPRRASIIGSTNKAEFLTDDTGSVRWLCFTLFGINWEYKKDIDINLVWAQAYYLYKSGFEYNMTAEEIIENELANAQFSTITMEFELVQKHFEPGNKEDDFMTPSDMIQYLSKAEGSNLKISREEIGKALKRLGFERIAKRGYSDKSYPVKGYYVKIDNPLTTLLQ